jgi:hypothetical protein
MGSIILANVASSKPTRRSRKRRVPGSAPAPRAVSPPRRELRAERQVLAERQQSRDQRMLGVYGKPPESPFGGLPISELAILVGGVGVVVGLVAAAPAALIVGIVACTLGVVEVTAREHFSGYRSHAVLLAGIPAVVAGIAMIALFGSSLKRAPLLLVVVVVFVVAFRELRKRFRTARQARIARPPAP